MLQPGFWSGNASDRRSWTRLITQAAIANLSTWKMFPSLPTQLPAGSAAIFAAADGTPVAMLFAATYPERITALVLCGSSARVLDAADYPIGLPAWSVEEALRPMKERWGDASAPMALEILAPRLSGESRWRNVLARMQRLAATPTAADAYWRMNIQIDVRSVLSAINRPHAGVAHNRRPPIPDRSGKVRR